MKRISVLVLCLAASGLLVADGTLAGTHAHSRSGFFIGLGLGWGNAGATLQSAEAERENSGSGNFRFGWSVAENITIGLENSSWVKQYDIEGTGLDLNLTAAVTTFAVTYFPQNMGLYMRGGLGFATARAEVEGGGASVSETENGLGLLGAVGYEWRLTDKFALGPQAQWTYMNIDDEVTDSIDFVSVTAQATWYW